VPHISFGSAPSNWTKERKEMNVEYLDGDKEQQDHVSRAGHARIIYQNGDVFEGSFDDDKKKHGNSIYKFASFEEKEEEQGSLTEFRGVYVHGERGGVGNMSYADGSKYIGEWKQGFRHGKGSYTYANGDVFSGSWKSGKRHGKGVYLFREHESRLEGVWDMGKPIKGTFHHPDGTCDEGFFDESQNFRIVKRK